MPLPVWLAKSLLHAGLLLMAECPGCVPQSMFAGWKIPLKPFYQSKSPFLLLRSSSSDMASAAWAAGNSVPLSQQGRLFQSSQSEQDLPRWPSLMYGLGDAPKYSRWKKWCKNNPCSQLLALLHYCCTLLLLGPDSAAMTGIWACKETGSEAPILGALGVGSIVSTKPKGWLDCA